MFYGLSREQIRRGEVTDVYFLRARDALRHRGVDKTVRMEVMAKSFPPGYPWAVFAGMEEVADILEGVPVTVQSFPEGTFFRPYQPVCVIEGRYMELGIFETAILGILCHSSGVATKAARVRSLVPDKPLIHFGSRRVHPAIAAVIERNAYIGGCDGVSNAKGAELLGIEPTGTMPHALVLLLGDTIEATRALDDTAPRQVPRVALVDTFGDERFEAVRLASALGKHLHAVRLDTPSSRRGDMKRIVEEVRWELDQAGHPDVRILVSGGLDEAELLELREAADAFGVGTAIGAAPHIDFSLDIVEIDGHPISKRGKSSGMKNVLRCEACREDKVVPVGLAADRCAGCGGAMRGLSEKVMEKGRLVRPLPPPRDIRARVVSQARTFGL